VPVTLPRGAAVPLAYALGTCVCAVSMGLLPVLLEMDGAVDWSAEDVAALGTLTLVVVVVEGLFWGAAVELTLGLGRWIAALVLGALAAGGGVVKLAVLGFALQEARRPSLFPRWGSWLAAGCDLLLLLSFAGVLGADDRARRGEAPGEVPRRAAWSWLSLIAALGVAIAPYLGLRLVAAAVLGVALWSFRRVLPGATARAFLGVPAALTLAVGVALAVGTAREHRVLSSPGLLGVSALPVAQHCYVRPAADFAVTGGSLWSVECSPGERRLVGWDEAGHRALEGEDLARRRSP
jgi:hypothetical protein